MTPTQTPSTLSAPPGLRIFVSANLQELAEERLVARRVIQQLGHACVMFEMGARPHPPQSLYRPYLQQSQVFVGIYYQRYGWIAPHMALSGLEDEYRLGASLRQLIYIKEPAPGREPRLIQLLDSIRAGNIHPKTFSTLEELRELLHTDLVQLNQLLSPLPSKEPQPAVLLSQLPAALTSLIGRDDEIAAVKGLLLRGERLVTLVGPGGVGKTRIAAEVARGLESQLADGVYFVSLSTLSDPALLVPSIARSFGLLESSSRPLMESLIEYLHPKKVLLVLDGFEGVLPAAPVVSELLGKAPGLQMLITSRAVLRLLGERDFAVSPLQLPKSGAGFEQLSQSEAVRLFVERAGAVNPEFSLTPENAATIGDICCRLDGLPLAIELAAVRIKVLQPRALLQRLSSRLKTLTDGPRDLPERQRTLRDTIEWSYRLLSAQEQQLFSCMSVFVAGSNLEAIEAVCHETDLDLLEEVGGLVEKSLLVQEQTGLEPRFSMLETIRELALEKLELSGQAPKRREMHAAYYLELAEAANAGRIGPRQMDWLERLDLEQANHRAALTWLIENQKTTEAVRMASSLRWFWDLRGQFSEGRRWLQEALNLPGEVPPLVRAGALMGLGVLLWRQGNYTTARPLMEESLALRRAHGDLEGIAYALQNLGNLATHLGDFASARAYQDENLAIRRRLGEKSYLADALFSRGNVALVEGKLSEARSLYLESFDAYNEVGDVLGLPFVLVNLAEVARQQGDYPAAQALGEDAQHLAEQFGDRLRLANALQSLGLTARDQGQPEAAQAMLQQSLQIYRELGHGLKIGFVTSELGTVMLQKGRLEAARQLFNQGLQTHQSLGLKPGIAYALLGLAETALQEGNLAEAKEYLRSGFPIAQQTTDPLTLARYLEALALLLTHSNPAQSARLLGAAQAMRQGNEIVRTPAEQPVLQAGLEQLSHLLDPATLEQLEQEGRALNLASSFLEMLN
ncbi:MAG: tetratricopeptide repeat protein [Meiothermus sp.]|nr:tetratricopeptide repeat protein [Meiothermus sp.]